MLSEFNYGVLENCRHRKTTPKAAFLKLEIAFIKFSALASSWMTAIPIDPAMYLKKTRCCIGSISIISLSGEEYKKK